MNTILEHGADAPETANIPKGDASTSNGEGELLNRPMLKIKRKGTPRFNRVAFESQPGERFSRLTFESCAWEMGRRPIWLLRCDCGNQVKAWYGDVIRGHTKSCGCLLKEINRARLTTHGEGNRLVREYRAWAHIKERCFNSKCKQFKHYGGRGITMCYRWYVSYDNFVSDMGRCPAGFTIERINNDGNYEPSNCRWASQKEQCQNTRRCLFFTYKGRTQNLKQWSSEFGKKYLKVYCRIKRGWSFHSALDVSA